MAGAITAGVSPNISSLLVELSGFPDSIDGKFMIPTAHLYCGVDNDGTFFIKNGERTVIVMRSISELTTFNGSPISTLSDLVSELYALV
jgi:hypothetical protein